MIVVPHIIMVVNNRSIERSTAVLKNERFRHFTRYHWAAVRELSQTLKYSAQGKVKTYTVDDLQLATYRLGLKIRDGILQDISEYSAWRAYALNEIVRNQLMDREEAEQRFTALADYLNDHRSFTANKQGGDKSHINYFTAIINLLTDLSLTGRSYDSDPQRLPLITKGGMPVQTLSRRMDGAYPGCQDPVAIWEIKEYYNTTSFGSKVADAVYIAQLDGMELASLRENEGIWVRNYLFIDGRTAWWRDGRSYLCRIVDMLHMGLIDEVIFGKEVFDRWPSIVQSW